MKIIQWTNEVRKSKGIFPPIFCEQKKIATFNQESYNLLDYNKYDSRDTYKHKNIICYTLYALLQQKKKI